MKAMLLRVGIDKSSGGTLGPIFADRTFEYIPIPEGDRKSRETKTYSNTLGQHGKPLSTYIPELLAGRKLHFDPEFNTFTYGDPTAKRTRLLELRPGDLLAFYAGLKPYQNNKFKEALYIIGYFTVKQVVDFNELSKIAMKTCYRKYRNNAHIKRSYSPYNLIIVVGNKGQSRLFKKAILISQNKYDRRGRAYRAVSKKMEDMLGISGSIQRSATPRIIYEKRYLDNLRGILGMTRQKDNGKGF